MPELIPPAPQPRKPSRRRPGLHALGKWQPGSRYGKPPARAWSLGGLDPVVPYRDPAPACWACAGAWTFRLAALRGWRPSRFIRAARISSWNRVCRAGRFRATLVRPATWSLPIMDHVGESRRALGISVQPGTISRMPPRSPELRSPCSPWIPNVQARRLRPATGR